MADPASFIRDRIAAWQALAEAAARDADDGSHFGGRGSWAHRFGMVTDAEDPDWAITGDLPWIAGDAVHAHIAVNDPARVLRQVAAIRAILDSYEMWRAHADSDPAGVMTPSKAAAGTLLSALRSLAAIWDDHPDYRPAVDLPTASHRG